MVSRSFCFGRRQRMNKELLELLDSINDKKAEVKKLVEEDKLDEAKKAKDELKEMQRLKRMMP